MEPMARLLQPQDDNGLICCVMAVLFIVECKCSYAYVLHVASRKQVNLLTTLDTRAAGILHFD